MSLQDTLFGYPNQGSLNKLLGFPGQDVARKEPPRLIQAVAVGTTSATLAADPIQGDTLIACIGTRNNVSISVSGGTVTTWTRAATIQTASNSKSEIWYGVVDAPVVNRVVAWAGAGISPGIALMEWALPYRQLGSIVQSSSGGAGSIVSGALASRPNEIIVTVGCGNSASQIGGPGAGWNGINTSSVAVNAGYAFAFGATMTATYNNGAVQWSVCLAAFS